MTDCKFKVNVPKSITVSLISDFNCDDKSEKKESNDPFDLGVDQADSDIDENE